MKKKIYVFTYPSTYIQQRQCFSSTDPDVPAEEKLQVKDLDPRRTVLQGQGSAGGRTLMRGTQRLFVQALLVAQSLVASSTIYKQQWGKTIAHYWGDPRALCLCPPVSLPSP